MECDSAQNDQENRIDNACKKNIVVLSPKRYKKLLNASQSKERQAEQNAKDEAYVKFQKEAGEALAAKYTGKKQPTLNEKMSSQRADSLKISEEAAHFVKKFKDKDEQVRLEKIARAEELIEKTKPGARSLKSAAITSEVLRERNVQMVIKNYFEGIVGQENEKLVTACVSLNNPWIPDDEKRSNEKLESINNYKKDLLKTIGETIRQKKSLRKQQLLEERAESELINIDIQKKIEKERLALENKRATLRKNAIEAMKMVEQRRQRESMLEEAEERLNCVYNEGKRQLDEQVKSKKEEILAEKVKKVEECAKKVAALNEQKDNEEERLEKDINQMKLKFTEAELEKKRKEKAAKQARIEAHLREVERQKQRKQNYYELQRFEMAQRFKNDEVNCAFEMTKKQERLRALEEFRSILKQQMEQKAKQEKENVECMEEDPYIKDDEKFFSLARQYIIDSKKKERPLYPFIKAIEDYKRENQVDCTKTLPKHLLSQIAIGCRNANDKKDNLPKNDRKQRFLEGCLEVNKLLHDSTQKCLQDTKKRIVRGRGGQNGGFFDTFSGTNVLSKYKSASPLNALSKVCCPDTKSCDKCNALTAAQTVADTLSTATSEIKEKKSPKKSAAEKQLRYSMCHLKYINQTAVSARHKNKAVWR